MTHSVAETLQQAKEEIELARLLTRRVGLHDDEAREQVWEHMDTAVKYMDASAEEMTLVERLLEESGEGEDGGEQ